MSADRSVTPAEDIIITTLASLGHSHQVLGTVTGAGAHSNAEKAADRAIAAARASAHGLGADAVLGLSLSHATLPETSYSITQHSVIAYGTAVLLPWPAGHADPALGLEP